jgi:hypothetical protein
MFESVSSTRLHSFLVQAPVLRLARDEHLADKQLQYFSCALSWTIEVTPAESPASLT